jgi:DNA repair protein RecN (Recombination protein N)
MVITHLPQIAAFASAHFRIAKSERDGRIVSQVRQIADEDRVDELAAMLDGEPVTAASQENAREMLRRVERWISQAPSTVVENRFGEQESVPTARSG